MTWPSPSSKMSKSRPRGGLITLLDDRRPRQEEFRFGAFTDSELGGALGDPTPNQVFNRLTIHRG